MSYKSIFMGLALLGTMATGANAHDYTIVDDTIPASLTGVPGDPVKGKKLAINRKKGNCLACHQMPIPEQQFHGDDCERGPRAQLHRLGICASQRGDGHRVRQ